MATFLDNLTTAATPVETAAIARGNAIKPYELLAIFTAASTAAGQPVLATGAGHSVDDVITVLQTLGLVKQS